MASLTTHIVYCSAPPSPHVFNPSKQHLFRLPTQSLSVKLRNSHRVEAQGSLDLLGDLGARDPFPAEIASKFGEKVLGDMDTEHKILIPTAACLSLASLECSPISPSQPPMSLDDAQTLLLKVVGWRLLDDEEGLKLQCLWKVKDFQSGVELMNRISKVAEAVGHFPTLHHEQPNQVTAELWTPSIGGLSMNDFILAAKIDEVKTSDLVPRRRVWA